MIMSSNPSILSHVSLGTNQLDRALAFYDKALGALGIGRVVDMSQEHHAVAYGRASPEFWVQAPFNGKPAEVANGVHIAFHAETPAQVDAFYKAALEAGGRKAGQIAHHANTTSEVPASFASVVAEVHQLHDDINAILLGARR